MYNSNAHILYIHDVLVAFFSLLCLNCFHSIFAVHVFLDVSSGCYLGVAKIGACTVQDVPIRLYVFLVTQQSTLLVFVLTVLPSL
ncbi:hypothetical protein BDP27DRAFT_1324774 [Rhodocollybia butyracea]|uniref:Uncharacterized protein n=1 Tax=Rhodocollybia butyracea TaxID=206335 RepID=A0A9P5PV54_9AGAR|nr:hypothetical protein BDP27DRAFT_1324774 [Rhodocollybia butyracea]